MDGGFSLILLVAGLVLLFLIIVNTFRIVPDYERLVILQLGRYKGTRGPGLTIVIPLLERAIKRDLREDFFDIPAQTAITRDNAPIAIDFLVYYRIEDPRLSVLKVDDVIKASINIATTTLRAVIGDIDLDDVLSKRDQINDTLRVKLDETTARWGLKVTSVEIREIEPPKEVLNASVVLLSPGLAVNVRPPSPWPKAPSRLPSCVLKARSSRLSSRPRVNVKPNCCGPRVTPRRWLPSMSRRSIWTTRP